MGSYKRRVIYASVLIHALALIGIFFYWILNASLEIPKETKHVPSQPLYDGEKSNEYQEPDVPDTGKNPLEEFAEGDLSKPRLQSLFNNSIKNANKLSLKEKAEKLTEKFNHLSKTSIKDVKEASDLISRSLGVTQTKSKQPMREYNALKGIKIDPNSTRLYDYKIIDGKYALIYKDKNNVYIQSPPVSLDELEPFEKVNLKLIKAAKENTKFRILLEAAQNIISPTENK